MVVFYQFIRPIAILTIQEWPNEHHCRPWHHWGTKYANQALWNQSKHPKDGPSQRSTATFNCTLGDEYKPGYRNMAHQPWVPRALRHQWHLMSWGWTSLETFMVKIWPRPILISSLTKLKPTEENFHRKFAWHATRARLHELNSKQLACANAGYA